MLLTVASPRISAAVLLTNPDARILASPNHNALSPHLRRTRDRQRRIRAASARRARPLPAPAPQACVPRCCPLQMAASSRETLVFLRSRSVSDADLRHVFADARIPLERQDSLSDGSTEDAMPALTRGRSTTEPCDELEPEVALFAGSSDDEDDSEDSDAPRRAARRRPRPSAAPSAAEEEAAMTGRGANVKIAPSVRARRWNKRSSFGADAPSLAGLGLTAVEPAAGAAPASTAAGAMSAAAAATAEGAGAVVQPLVAEGRCEKLAEEVEEGNVEYKWKLVDPSPGASLAWGAAPAPRARR